MEQLVFSDHTGSHPILVTDEHACRSLRFGTDERQSCINLHRPWELQLAYTQWMMSALLLHPAPSRFLLFGLGGGAIPHFLLHHLPEARIDAVEKERRVIDVASAFFKLPATSRLRVIHDEAAHFLCTAAPAYDIIFVDLFGPGIMIELLYQPEFYRSVIDLLVSDGVLAVNLWSGDKHLFQLACASVRHGCNNQVLQMQVKKRSNVILLAFPRTVPKTALRWARKNASSWQQRYHLDFPLFLKRLRRTNRSLLSAFFS
jgi:spermidine synthase